MAAQVATIVEIFPKATTTPEEIEAERQSRLDPGGAKTSVVTDDGSNYVLTSTYGP